MTKPLDGRVALITGAGRGIGRAVADAFARAGARVVVNDAGTEPDGENPREDIAEAAAQALREAGAEAVASAEDVAAPDGAERAVQKTIDAFGRIDVLLCCAGFLKDALLHKMDSATFESVLKVHAFGTFACIRSASERMKRAGGGRIVTTTGLAGLLGNYGQCNYAAGAAATYALTRTASIELQRHSIFVNAVAPLAKTRLTRDLPMFEHVESMRPEHAAPAYVFLGSDLCGDATGNVLAVAGGKLSVYRLVESFGHLKESDEGIWTPEEIQEHWDSLSRERF